MKLELSQAAGTDTTVLLTAPEVAEMLRTTRRTVDRMATRGDLPRVRFTSGMVRFRLADVEALIERRTGASV